MSHTASWVTPVILVEIPVVTSMTGAVIAYMFRDRRQAGMQLKATLGRLESRLEIDANDDLMRDKRLESLERRTAADHDLLIEWAGWSERHDTWSKERWDAHIREYHPRTL